MTAERDDRLQNAIDRIKNLDDSMKVNLKGKKYTMVAQRVQAFREAFGCGANVETEIIVCDDTKVIVKATVSVQRDGAWVPIATEFAEEYRGVGPVNKTSALENCCTSSIGRALAACGLSGGEYASSFEVDNAINNKAEAPAKPKKVAESIDKTKEDSLEKWVSANDKTSDPTHFNLICDGPTSEQDAENIMRIVGMALMKDGSTVDYLKTTYDANIKFMTDLQEKDPALYKRVMAVFTARKEEILEADKKGKNNA